MRLNRRPSSPPCEVVIMKSSAASRVSSQRGGARSRFPAYIVVILLLAVACGLTAAAQASSGSQSRSVADAGASSDTTVHGQVTDGATGAPMPGVIVEFRNLRGENVHLPTDQNGRYSVELPADVYTALAVADDPNSTINFRVVGGSNVVSVPPPAEVDFVSY
jgi:hypothetical protein